MDVPTNIETAVGSEVNTKAAFGRAADALVSLERIRKVLKLEFDQKIKPAYRKYKDFSQEKKDQDETFALASQSLRDKLAGYLTREDESGEDLTESVRFDLPEGLRLLDKEVVCIHDMAELVQAVAEGRADIELLMPNMKLLQQKLVASGGLNIPPGTSVEKSKEFRVGKQKETENE